MTRSLWLALPIFILFSVSAAGQRPGGPPGLVFSPHSVGVTGVTPGADVYLYSVSREAMGYYNDIVTREEVLHDTAKAGRVEYLLKGTLASRSIWFAVDLASGMAVAGAPPGYPARQVTLDEHQLKKGVGGDVEKLSFDGVLVDILVVRQGAGMWGGPVGLHAKNDENPKGDATAYRTPLISAGNLEARGGTKTPAPAKLKNGDVVFMMNSWGASYGMAIIGGGK